jgi:type IV secretion system protein TrbJ
MNSTFKRTEKFWEHEFPQAISPNPLGYARPPMKKTTATIALILVSSISRGTIPVIDYASITQEIKQGLTQLQQYSNAVQQLQTQIATYKNQLLQATGIAPAAQLWQTAQGSLNQLTGVVNMFQSEAGVQGYLQNAKDINYWLESMPTGQSVSQSLGYWSGSQKTANQQLVQEIQQQEQQIASDSQALQRLQAQASSAVGTNQALTVGNEMAALQQKQLMEVRTLLISEQQALAANSGSASTKQAMQDAATKDAFNSPYTYTEPETGWRP